MINEENYELFLFRYQENLLSAEERKEVEAYLAAHPEHAEEMDLYDKGLLLGPLTGEKAIPDPQWADTMMLKAMNHKRTYWRRTAGVAACVAMLIGGGYWGMDHLNTGAGNAIVAESPMLAQHHQVGGETVDPELGDDNIQKVQPRQGMATEQSAAAVLYRAETHKDESGSLIVNSFNDGSDLMAEVYNNEAVPAAGLGYPEIEVDNLVRQEPVMEAESMSYPEYYTDDLIQVEYPSIKEATSEALQFLANTDKAKELLDTPTQLASNLYAKAKNANSKLESLKMKVTSFQDRLEDASNQWLAFNNEGSLLPSVRISRR